MSNKVPPPIGTQDPKFLPDYYLGCLLYLDDTPDNNMRWICYDGRQRIRCISKEAAMSCAEQLHHLITKDGLGHLMHAHHYLTRAWHSLDHAAAQSDIETRLWLELKAVEVHKLADAIDILISQRINSNQ